MLTEIFAQDHILSDAARKRAIKQGGYFCFEEDIEWMIPAFELPAFWPQIFSYASEAIKADPYTSSAIRPDLLE